MGHSILNMEGGAALVCLLIAIVRARPSNEQPAAVPVPDWLMLSLVVLATAAAFWRVLGFPLLHDSYDLTYIPFTQTFPDVAKLFYTRSPTGDFFFRPLSFLLFWIYSKWAHFNPIAWHAMCLAVHIVNCDLVYLLARQLSFAAFTAGVTALVFALHGSRPEAVAWVAARVDLFATFFVLLTLIAATGRRVYWTAMILCAIAATLCKESAFCLPLLFAALLPFQGDRRRALRIFATLAGLCGVVFVYRYWVIGGIGGYGAAGGSPTALHFDPIRTIHAIFFRVWAILFFPVNWSERSGPWICLGLLAMSAAYFRAYRQRLLGALGFTVAAVLPAHQLLLIGGDLGGARVLYLPVLGVALFWGTLLAGLRQAAFAPVLLVFHLCALEHNLSIWGDVARESQRVCSAFAKEIPVEAPLIKVEPLPIKRKGVFFLNNGFGPCLLMNSGGRLRELPRIVQVPAGAQYHWDENAMALKRVY